MSPTALSLTWHYSWPLSVTEHTGVMANTVVDYKRLMSEAGLPDGVLDGDLVALSNVLGNNIKTPVCCPARVRTQLRSN